MGTTGEPDSLLYQGIQVARQPGGPLLNLALTFGMQPSRFVDSRNRARSVLQCASYPFLSRVVRNDQPDSQRLDWI